MAIPSNGFEVIFTQKLGEIEKQIKVERFVTDEKDLYENKEELTAEIKENLGVTITLSLIASGCPVLYGRSRNPARAEAAC